MPFYPPFNFPFYFNNYKKSQNLYNSSIFNTSVHNTKNLNNIPYNTANNSLNKQPSNNTNNDIFIKKASETVEASEAFFEIFGLKLFFDDILIICILFFLYTEKVHDDELFICLILLLLT